MFFKNHSKILFCELVGSTRSTTSASITATTQRSIVSVTKSGDRIIGLYNTTAGRSTGGFNGTYSSVNEYPLSAIDANTSTKYLNFGYKGCPRCIVYGPGIGTGFFVTPSISNATIARALLFATGNDSPNRDPITVTLEGSNASTITMLHQGSSWTLIYNGSTGISQTIDPGRETYVIQQNFSNTTPYSSYRLLITSQRGNDNSVQYSESRIIGYV